MGIVTKHHLQSSPDTVTNFFSRDLPPVLSVEAGDQVTIDTYDVLGHLKHFENSNSGVQRLTGDNPGLTVAGPIEVRGAEPGMMLAVQVTDLKPDDWGWTMSSWQHSGLERSLGVESADINWLTWDLDNEKGVARSSVGLSVDLNPFLGIIGLTPSEPGEHSLIPPYASGGNIDCRALSVGATLYLPVMVPGAMLLVGDGHGVQGDGEVSGTAVECAMRSTIKVGLVTDPPVSTMHADTTEGRVTFGLSADLNEATEQALQAMLDWIQQLHGVTRTTALALASAAVDLRITQIASPVWGVHAVLPPTALRRD